MGKGMSMGKGKGMAMGKGKGSVDDDDNECNADIGKGSKMGKGSNSGGGSKKGGKGGGGKGLMFVSEYDTLWSPKQHKNRENGTFDLAIVEQSRLESSTTATNATITLTTTNSSSSLAFNSSDITEVSSKDEYRNSTDTVSSIPADHQTLRYW